MIEQTGVSNILLVDDRPENLMVLESLLEAPELNLVKATSGKEALEQMISTDFALVLLDVQMPEMDGFEVAQIMRDSTKTQHIPIIFVTAISKDDKFIFKGYESGAVDYLFKPVEPDILRSKVNVFLELYQQRKKLESEIQERKRIEEELKEAKQIADRTTQAKSQFLANMSHEIRTPMNAIIGMTDLALDMPLNDELREYLTIVKSSSDLLLTLINDIIDFSKIEAGKLDLEHAEFDLRETLRDTLHSLAIRAHDKNLELLSFIAPDLPDTLIGDSTRLRQIIINLTGNAIKFTKHGEINLYVEREAETGDGIIIHFQVRDTGIGIPKDKQDLIFLEFEQADLSTTRNFGGTGLGLAISTKLTEMMGGRIWVESYNSHTIPDHSGGMGSTFHFNAVFGCPQETATPEKPAVSETLGGIPVLIADDNESLRKILSSYLSHWQMKPSQAAREEEIIQALDAVHQSGNLCQLLLLDSKLPGMDVWSFTESLRQHPIHSEIKIVALVPLGEKLDLNKCRQLNITTVSKPIFQPDLLNAIQTVLGLTVRETGMEDAISSKSTTEPGRRILVAEDNPFNQKLASKLLEKNGHHVTIAETGAKALECLETERFDIILMDVHMPEMDGMEATIRIREKEKQTGGHIPILAVTANALKGDMERCLEVGMDDYVSKPIDAKIVLRKIQQFTRGASPVAAVPPTETDESAPSTSPISNPDFILDQVDGELDQLKELTEMFWINSQEIMGNIHTAVDGRDFDALRMAAHSLKGVVAFYQAERAREIALRLEMMGRNRESQHLDETWVELVEEMDKLKVEMRRLGWVDD